MIRLLVTRELPEAVLAAARAEFGVTLRAGASPMDADEAGAALAAYDAILPTIGDAFTAEAFAAAGAPRCRLLANFGAGVNHIDTEAARAAGVVVTNTPGVVTEATADIALMLILMSARRAGEGERLVRAGRWGGWRPTQMLGTHASGKTLGVVGMGNIGRAVARRCHHGLGMEVAFYSRSAVAEPGVPAVQVAELTELAGGVDFLVAAVPGGAATRHLIGPAVLAAMRASAHLVNVSRGDVVDEAALIEAVEARRIAGAGLDVYEHEPAVPERLCALENVVLLPHLGTAAREVREAMGMMALDNVRAMARGAPAPNAV